MELEAILKFAVLAIGFYMAWNIGANDVANAMGTSVGSRALTLRKAVLIAAVLEFSGAFFVGANVSETMQKGLIVSESFQADPLILVLGMSGALLGAAIWLHIASYFGWPVSTTHAIVGAIVGFGAAVGGIETVKWGEIGAIASSWVVSPLLSGLISYAMFVVLQREILYKMNPIQATKKFIPWLVFVFLIIFCFSLLFNGLKNLHLNLSFSSVFLLSIGISSLGGLIAYFLVNRNKAEEKPVESPTTEYTPQTVHSLNKAIKHLQRVRISTVNETNEQVSHLLHEVRALSQKIQEKVHFAEPFSDYRSVEKMFVYLQIMSACFVAFSHGANDVANAIGPVAAVLDILKNNAISEVAFIPPWLLALGGIGIVIGLATWGWRVIETIGRKITELTPTRGFCAEFGAATTILIASKMGLPISTTHCLVGSVLGVGIAGGLKALNLSTLREIVLSWLVTLPASALTSIGFFYLLKFLVT